METNSPPTSKQKQRVAVPYYGRLTHPQTGLAQLFFLADVDQQGGEGNEVQLRIWDRKQYPRLVDWLRDSRVTGLLCSEADNPHLKELIREGVEVFGGIHGDAEEILAQWLSSDMCRSAHGRQACMEACR